MIEITEKSFSMTNAEMLDEINKAIYSILAGGQSYMIGSRKLTRADLSQLYKMRQDLEAQELADNNRNGFFNDCYVAVWPDTR